MLKIPVGSFGPEKLPLWLHTSLLLEDTTARKREGTPVRVGLRRSWRMEQPATNAFEKTLWFTRILFVKLLSILWTLSVLSRDHTTQNKILKTLQLSASDTWLFQNSHVIICWISRVVPCNTEERGHGNIYFKLSTIVRETSESFIKSWSSVEPPPMGSMLRPALVSPQTQFMSSDTPEFAKPRLKIPGEWGSTQDRPPPVSRPA